MKHSRTSWMKRNACIMRWSKPGKSISRHKFELVKVPGGYKKRCYYCGVWSKNLIKPVDERNAWRQAVNQAGYSGE